MKNNITILKNYIVTKYFRKFNSREQLLTWQEEKVINFLKNILPQSKFYADYYQGLNINQWQKFPTINKSIMMANFDELNTVGIKKKEAFELAIKGEKDRNFSSTLNNYTVGLSSGTSGNRGLFIVSQKEQQIWAGTILAKTLPQFILYPQKIAFFLRANSNLYETVKKQRIQFQYFDLFNSVDSNREKLNQFKPTILVAPPSMLRLLAEAKLKGNLNINPLKIISVAEVLDPLDESYISNSFQQKIHQLYQCTEGFLGSTCKYGNLHLNEDILVIQKEYIDQNSGKFMPIITDFNRKTQPIIRYQLDDILTESKTPCACGSVLTVLESIEGRKDDIFWLLNQTEEKLIPIFPDFIRRSIIMVDDNIEEYKVIQKSINEIDIFLKIPTKLKLLIQDKIDKSLESLWIHYGCNIPKINYKEYEIRNDHHQKMRRIQREFNPNN
jgi:putative adenylate-forming enzyme